MPYTTSPACSDSIASARRRSAAGFGDDLRRLPRRQVLLDRQQHRLLHAAVLALSRLLELIFEFGRKPESHRHGTMIPKRFRFIPQMISHAAVAALGQLRLQPFGIDAP